MSHADAPLSFLIPYFNKASSLDSLALQLEFLKARYPNSEFLIVDDGSLPEQSDALENFDFKLTKLCRLRFPRNRGKAAALIHASESATLWSFWAQLAQSDRSGGLTSSGVSYELRAYRPGHVSFDFDAVLGQSYIWAESRDNFWRLRLDGKNAEFCEAPAHLRCFVATATKLKVEMEYLGPFSRLWRR